MPASNISEWEAVETDSSEWEPLSPREEKKAQLKSQQQAIAAQGEVSTLRALDAEVAERIGQFKKGAAQVIPSALKTAAVIGSQPNYEAEYLETGTVTPRPKTPPEATTLFQLGEMAQERMSEVWSEPEVRDVWHDVARGGGQVSQMVGGGAVLKGLGAGTQAATAAAVASGGVQEFDDAFSRSRLRGDDPDTALAKSLGYATVAGMIESRLGAGRLLRQLYPSAKEAAQALTAAGVSKKLIGNFIAGGVEEGAQRLAQNWIVEGEPSMEGVTEEAIPGAIVQGIVGAPGAAVTSGQSPTAEFLRRAGAPATAAVAEEINLPLLKVEDVQREVAPISIETAEAGLWEAIPEAAEGADIRGLAQPSAPRITPEQAEAGLRETLPLDETTDIRKAPTPIGEPPVLTRTGEKEQGGGVKETLKQDPYNGNEEFYRGLLNESSKTTRMAGPPVDIMVSDGVLFGDAIRLAQDYYPNFGTPEYKKYQSSKPTPKSPASPLAPSPEPKTEAVVEQAAASNVPARVKLPNSPQTYTTLERLPQTEVEKANGEQPVRIKNERTGKEEIVLESELSEVKAATTKKPRRTKAELNKALREARLDPSVFPDAKSKKSALERAIGKIEEAQAKLRGSRSTLSMGIPKAALDLILEAARLSLKAGNSLAKALEAAMAKARELLSETGFNEDELREQITTELTKTERKETDSAFWTGQQESGSRSRQVTQAEQFTDGKTTDEILNAVATVAGKGEVSGLSPENVPAVLARVMRRINERISETTNPIELSELWRQLDRAANLFQQQASESGRQLEANKVAREQLSGMAPLLTFRGLAKKAWAKALNIKSEDAESDVTKIVTDSAKEAAQEVASTPTEIKVDEALMKAVRESGINLSTLFMDNDHATQAARRKHLFEQIRKAFPNLNTDQKLQLEKALMDAWEKARLKIFRRQFKKFVGLPEVAEENILDAIQPELIRQANLGTLDDEAFRAAVAKKLGLPQMDGETAKRMIELAQEAQAAPEGVLRNKVTQKMVDELHKLNQFHPFDIARDYWYANALSGTRTWVAVLSSMAHGVTLTSQRAAELALKGNINAAANIAWAYVLDVGEGIANAWDVIQTGDYTRRAEFGQNIDALLRGKGRLDTLEGMKKHGDAIWKKAIGQTAYARRLIIGLDYISAIATRGSEIIYGSALQKDAKQLEMALRRFNREAAEQAKTQAKSELGPNAKWVDVRARQLEILNEGVAQETIDQATLMGEIVALNAPLIGATGAVHEIFKSFPRAIKAAGIPGTQKSADALSFVLSTVIGSPFIRATLNMVANASNYMPLIGGMNWARANMNPETTPGYLKWLALVDQDGKPLSPQRRNSIIAAQLYGIAMTGAAYLLARAGDDDEEKGKKFDITGTWKGMKPEERKARMAAGERPLSLVINGEYISYATQPMAGALVVAGNMRDKDRATGPSDPEAGAERIFEAMISGPAYIKDLSTLSGMSAMAGWGAMRTDDATWFNRILAAQGRNAVTAVVPFASLVREADTWFDPQVYRPKEPLHYWIANVPWMRASAAHGPEYSMAGIPVENYLTPQSRMVAKQPNDPLLVALGQAIENGVTPKYPSTGDWIKDGEKFTPTQQGKLTYKHQVETLKAWREIMLPMKDEIAKMTPREYEEFYKKELLPVSQEIHDALQNELDPDVLKRKTGATRGQRKFERNPRYEMKGEE